MDQSDDSGPPSGRSGLPRDLAQSRRCEQYGPRHLAGTQTQGCWPEGGGPWSEGLPSQRPTAGSVGIRAVPGRPSGTRRRPGFPGSEPHGPHPAASSAARETAVGTATRHARGPPSRATSPARTPPDFRTASSVPASTRPSAPSSRQRHTAPPAIALAPASQASGIVHRAPSPTTLASPGRAPRSSVAT